MDRLTEKNKNGQYVAAGQDMEKVIQRLGEFEDAYQDLMDSREQTPKILEEMRLQGKEKTIRYKETMAQKLINLNLVAFFESHGLR